MKNTLGLEPYFCEEHLDDYTIGMIKTAKESPGEYNSHCGEYYVWKKKNPVPMVYVARIIAMVRPDVE